jgi:signal transduction histidine kinase
MNNIALSGIRARLLLLVFLTIMPALGMVVYTAADSRESDIREAEQFIENFADLVAKEFDQLIVGGHQLLRTLAHLPQLQAENADACNALLKKIAGLDDPFFNFAVVGPRGDVICSGTPASEAVDVADQNWFLRTVRTHQFTVGDYELDRITGTSTIVLAYPLLNQQKLIEWIVVASVDPSWVSQTLQLIEIPASYTLAVVDRTGKLLVSKPDGDKWIGKSLREGSLLNTILRKGRGVTQSKPLHGKDHFFAFAPVTRSPTGNLYTIAGVPKEVALVEAERTLRLNLAGLGVIAIAAASLAWIGGGIFFVRRVKKLANVAKRVEAGDLTARTELTNGPDELGDLARAFDHMMDRLQTQDRALRILHDVEQATSSTLDLQQVLVIILDKIEETLPYSATTLRLYNHGTGFLEPVMSRNLDAEHWKKNAGDFQSLGPPRFSRTVFECKAPLAVRNIPSDPRTTEAEVFAKQGLISYLGLPLIAEDEVLGVLGLFTKVEHEFSAEEINFLTTLAGRISVPIHNSQLYQKIKNQALELDKANKLQADFTAMIVHDLRSPLMNIISIASLLEDGLFGEMTAEQKKWAGKINVNSSDLANLVSDILDLSKLEAGHLELVKDSIDLGEFIRSSLETYFPRAKEKRISLNLNLDSNVGGIDGDPRRLDQLLGNLISNAIKFTAEGGAIEVGSRLQGFNEVKIWVKDSGVGIPPDEIGSMFQKYRQMSNANAVGEKGTGLGLVISKMIVEAHGGRIEVESEPGKGSTFTIAIPLRQPESSRQAVAVLSESETTALGTACD